MRSVFEQGHFTSIQEQYWVFCGVCFASGKLILENFRQCTNLPEGGKRGESGDCGGGWVGGNL
jgi:hypothetical protein